MDQARKVFLAYRLYCYACAAMHFGFIFLGLWFARFQGEHLDFVSTDFILWTGRLLVPGAALFCVMNAAAPSLPKNLWTWALHLSNIMVGMIYCWTIPWGAALIYYWYRPSVKAMFAVPESR